MPIDDSLSRQALIDRLAEHHWSAPDVEPVDGHCRPADRLERAGAERRPVGRAEGILGEDHAVQTLAVPVAVVLRMVKGGQLLPAEVSRTGWAGDRRYDRGADRHGARRARTGPFPPHRLIFRKNDVDCRREL